MSRDRHSEVGVRADQARKPTAGAIDERSHGGHRREARQDTEHGFCGPATQDGMNDGHHIGGDKPAPQVARVVVVQNHRGLQFLVILQKAREDETNIRAREHARHFGAGILWVELIQYGLNRDLWLAQNCVDHTGALNKKVQVFFAASMNHGCQIAPEIGDTLLKALQHIRREFVGVVDARQLLPEPSVLTFFYRQVEQTLIRR